MTCIAAAYRNGYGAIGCDSMVSGGGTGLIASSKILALGSNVYAGIAGAAVTIEQVRASADCEATNAEELEEYLRQLSSEMRKSENHDSLLLVLSPWGIWQTMAAGVFKVTHPIAAIGSGGDIALGAMNTAVKRPWWTPQATVKLGLKHACEVAPGCGYPIHVKSI